MKKKTDVLILYLPVTFGGGHNYTCPPLGVYYLASALKASGVDARVLDVSVKGLSLDEAVQSIILTVSGPSNQKVLRRFFEYGRQKVWMKIWLIFPAKLWDDQRDLLQSEMRSPGNVLIYP